MRGGLMFAHGPRHRAVFLALVLLAVPACGGKDVAEVEGTVLFNKKPVKNVLIEFLPDVEHGTRGPRSTAITDDQGHYSLHFDDLQPGAVVGHHRVVMLELDDDPDRDRKGEGHRPDAKAGSTERPANRALLPASYKKATSTPLKRELQPGKQTIDFNLP